MTRKKKKDAAKRATPNSERRTGEQLIPNLFWRAIDFDELVEEESRFIPLKLEPSLNHTHAFRQGAHAHTHTYTRAHTKTHTYIYKHMHLQAYARAHV